MEPVAEVRKISSVLMFDILKYNHEKKEMLISGAVKELLYEDALRVIVYQNQSNNYIEHHIIEAILDFPEEHQALIRLCSPISEPEFMDNRIWKVTRIK